jgi:hypothetical protein
MAANTGCIIHYRQIRTDADFYTWTRAINGSRTGKRIVWLTGHGKRVLRVGAKKRSDTEVAIRMPDGRRTRAGNLLRPDYIFDCLLNAGTIEGIIVDSCEFGTNPAYAWVPQDAKWSLAYTRPVSWTESVFFGIKVLEWLYERAKHPRNGQEALRMVRQHAKTGGARNSSEKVQLSGLAVDLGACFITKQKGSLDWKVETQWQ